jgi:hypothetical protein
LSTTHVLIRSERIPAFPSILELKVEPGDTCLKHCAKWAIKQRNYDPHEDSGGNRNATKVIGEFGQTGVSTVTGGPNRFRKHHESVSRMQRIPFVLVLGICSVVATTRTRADSIDAFSYQSAGNTFVWQLPSSPTPDSGDVFPGFGFILNDIEVSENSTAPILGSFAFFSTASGGGIDLDFGTNSAINTSGPQLYSGPEASPTFLLGTFPQTDFAKDSDNPQPGILTVFTQSPVATPEPPSGALLGIGLVALAVVFITRRLVVEPS